MEGEGRAIGSLAGCRSCPCIFYNSSVPPRQRILKALAVKLKFESRALGFLIFQRFLFPTVHAARHLMHLRCALRVTANPVFFQGF